MTEISVKNIKGVGEKTAQYLEKLDIRTIKGLLKHYPVRYLEYKAPTKISEVNKDEEAVIKATIVKNISFTGQNRKISTTKITDYIDVIDVIWYNSPYLRATIKQGESYVFVGKFSKRSKSTLEHPIIYTLDEYEKKIGSFKPVYALTAGINNNAMEKLIKSGLEYIDEDDFAEYLPAFVLEKFSLESRLNSIKNIHNPLNTSCLFESKKRLAFDDFFRFLYGVKLLKNKRLKVKSKNIVAKSTEYLEEIKSVLPFKLTSSQDRVVDEILDDMSSGIVTNRLVQGDVGSGKTVIALISLYMAVKSGFQGVVMVPTEVLAKQHFKSMSGFLNRLKSPPRIGILTGSMTKKEHLLMYEKIESGEIDILIGTHALLVENVKFKNLGLVVTDEQHRFGVRQRTTLSDKGENVHVLVMSATPIPRTLAIILYGDLDISTIESKPVGRLPVKNAVITENDREKAYRHILLEIKKGHQAYIICPMVEESENIEAENVLDYGKKRADKFSQNCKVEVLHGRMQQKEKDDIMSRYVNKEIDILVSTTVIEVGVDVPNATVIMVENAERFGLATLHQLRGRVGRSELQSYAIFVRTSSSNIAKKRLEIIGNSNDGFYIASRDLVLRGPGELFGLAQSGEPDFGIADIYNDNDIFEMAKEAVDMIQCEDIGYEENEKLEREINNYMDLHYKKLAL